MQAHQESLSGLTLVLLGALFVALWCLNSLLSSWLSGSIVFPFRIGHPPLCIPWDEIEANRTKFLWRNYLVLSLGSEERIPMRVSESTAKKLGILERIRTITPEHKLSGAVEGQG